MFLYLILSYQNFPFVKQNYENLALFDGGWILPVTEQLLNGKKIYTEVNYAYGIIPVGIYFVFAHIFGNTPVCLFWVTGIVQILNMLLIFFVLKRYSNNVFSYTILLLIIVPLCFDKGISYTSPTPYEIMYLTSLTLVWKPFESRSKQRSIIIGLYLILPYFIKFGSHLIAGLTIFTLDLGYYIVNYKKKKISFSLFIKQQLYIGIGFFSSTVVLILGCLLYFPHEMALEFLWPYFRVLQYKKEFVHITTFPIYHNIGFFLGVQLPIIFVLALSIWAFFKNLNNIQQKEWNLMILTVFYLISCFIYFKNESYFYHYSWIAFIPAILINKLEFRLQIFFLIVTLPISINHARGAYKNIKFYESGKYHLIDTPSQDKLYFTDKQKRSFST